MSLSTEDRLAMDKAAEARGEQASQEYRTEQEKLEQEKQKDIAKIENAADYYARRLGTLYRENPLLGNETSSEGEAWVKDQSNYQIIAEYHAILTLNTILWDKLANLKGAKSRYVEEIGGKYRKVILGSTI